MTLIVIPNEVRNLSGFEFQGKERFLGAQRASEWQSFHFSAIC